ncbi:hypothetical protein AAMO2058_000227200 [Amorphochlora amoebiformis]
MAILSLLALIPLTFGAIREAGISLRAQASARPCDYKCCPCAEKTFSFKQKANKSESCIPCYDWVDAWMAPEYKDYCGTQVCRTSPYVAYPYDYTVVPRNYYTQFDYPRTYYHSNGSVVRHIPGVGNETLPPHWGTNCYGNGWGRKSYYYPRYSAATYYSRHHRRANTTAAEAAAQAAMVERAEIQASEGAHVPTVFKVDKGTLEAPCDFSCCSSVKDMFYFAPVRASTCTPCETWIEANVIPTFRTKCATEMKPYYTTIPHRYIRYSHDYMHDRVHLTNGTVVRHVPMMGDVRYPDHWPTPYNSAKPFYSMYMNGHYYYPDYCSYYYMPHSDAKPWTPATATWFYADGYY